MTQDVEEGQVVAEDGSLLWVIVRNKNNLLGFDAGTVGNMIAIPPSLASRILSIIYRGQSPCVAQLSRLSTCVPIPVNSQVLKRSKIFVV